MSCILIFPFSKFHHNNGLQCFNPSFFHGGLLSIDLKKSKLLVNCHLGPNSPSCSCHRNFLNYTSYIVICGKCFNETGPRMLDWLNRLTGSSNLNKTKFENCLKFFPIKNQRTNGPVMHHTFVAPAPSGPRNSGAFNFSIFKALLKALHCQAKFVVKSPL